MVRVNSPPNAASIHGSRKFIGHWRLFADSFASRAGLLIGAVRASAPTTQARCRPGFQTPPFGDYPVRAGRRPRAADASLRGPAAAAGATATRAPGTDFGSAADQSDSCAVRRARNARRACQHANRRRGQKRLRAAGGRRPTVNRSRWQPLSRALSASRAGSAAAAHARLACRCPCPHRDHPGRLCPVPCRASLCVRTAATRLGAEPCRNSPEPACRLFSSATSGRSCPACTCLARPWRVRPSNA